MQKQGRLKTEIQQHSKFFLPVFFCMFTEAVWIPINCRITKQPDFPKDPNKLKNKELFPFSFLFLFLFLSGYVLNFLDYKDNFNWAKSAEDTFSEGSVSVTFRVHKNKNFKSPCDCKMLLLKYLAVCLLLCLWFQTVLRRSTTVTSDTKRMNAGSGSRLFASVLLRFLPES